MRRSHFTMVFTVAVMAVMLLVGPALAQQPGSDAIWRFAPPDSLFIAGFDGRPDNPSVIALTKSQDPAMREQIAQQQIAMRKAVEDFATLFGISLDFAKDIDTWTGEQWLFAVVNDGDKGLQAPVFILASKDAAAANAALQKILAPFQRIGEVSTEPGAEPAIISFKTSDKGVEVYASASGPVVAFAPSKAALRQVLDGGGPAAGSTAEKAFANMSDCMFYIYADRTLAKTQFADLPVNGACLGVSVIDTGVKIRARGYLTDDAKAFVGQALAPKAGVRAVNPAIPSTALVAASMPDLGPIAGSLAGMTAGGSAPPIFDVISALDQTQVSAALTAVLPLPSGVAAAMADSDQAAADKLAKMIAALKLMKLRLNQTGDVTEVAISNDLTLHLTQSGPYVLAATDKLSLTGASSAAKGAGLAESETYKETLAALGDSNLLTLYANLAPIQGVGYLADALGLGQMSPMYAAAAKCLQDTQALGVGLGFDGEVVNAAIFLRAKPGIMRGIGPAVVPAAAIGAAVLFPVFAQSRESARVQTCALNMRELAKSAVTYAHDNGGKLPTRTKWTSQVMAYVTEHELACPTSNALYAFNKNLGGLILDNIQNPAEVVLFFEAKPGLPNATGSRANAILPHDGRGVFVYADGHVKLESSVPDQSHWVPKYAAPKPVKKTPAARVPPTPMPRQDG